MIVTNGIYEWHSNQNGDSHFYVLQFKTPRMRDWKNIMDSGDYKNIIEEYKNAIQRHNDLANISKQMKASYSNVKYRIIKIDCENLPLP